MVVAEDREKFYGIEKWSVIRPNAKVVDVRALQLRGYWPAFFWHLAYEPGDRIWSMDCPGFLRKAKENIYKFFVNDFYKESEIEKKFEGSHVVVKNNVCDFPEITVYYANEKEEVIQFKNFDDAEKKFRYLTHKYRLMPKPY